MRRTQVRRQFAEGNEGSLRRPSATLLVEQGHTCVRTSEQAGLPERKLRKWIKRLLEQGMAGLPEQPCSGHAPLFPPAVALSVVRLACEKRLVSATLAHGVHKARHALLTPCTVLMPMRPFVSLQVKRRRCRNRVRERLLTRALRA